MENASKALIIAGAILISILLISIGILVMNSINSPLSQAEEEGQVMSAQLYNSKFTPYMGEQSAKQVKKLMEVITSTNASAVIEEASSRYKKIIVITSENGDDVDINSANIIRDPAWVQAHVINSEKYKVEIIDGSYSWKEHETGGWDPQTEEGYIDTVKIYGKFK